MLELEPPVVIYARTRCGDALSEVVCTDASEVEPTVIDAPGILGWGDFAL